MERRIFYDIIKYMKVCKLRRKHRGCQIEDAYVYIYLTFHSSQFHILSIAVIVFHASKFTEFKANIFFCVKIDLIYQKPELIRKHKCENFQRSFHDAYVYEKIMIH